MTSREPYLSIVRGDATPEEIAALVAAIAARARTEPARAPQQGAWRDPARRMRGPLPRGRDGWRTAFFPGARV